MKTHSRSASEMAVCIGFNVSALALLALAYLDGAQEARWRSVMMVGVAFNFVSYSTMPAYFLQKITSLSDLSKPGQMRELGWPVLLDYLGSALFYFGLIASAFD